MPATTSATMWLTSAVIASLVTSIIDIIIHIFDNHKLTRIEKEKRMNELTTYRYTKLFDMLLKWKEYDTDFKTEGKNPSQIATDRVFNSFFDGYRRFEIISPLLDEVYKLEINDLYQQGKQLLDELFKIEYALNNKSSKELKEEHQKKFKEFISIAADFATEVEKVVHLQLEKLLKNSI